MPAKKKPEPAVRRKSRSTHDISWNSGVTVSRIHTPAARKHLAISVCQIDLRRSGSVKPGVAISRNGSDVERRELNAEASSGHSSG